MRLEWDKATLRPFDERTQRLEVLTRDADVEAIERRVQALANDILTPADEAS